MSEKLLYFCIIMVIVLFIGLGIEGLIYVRSDEYKLQMQQQAEQQIQILRKQANCEHYYVTVSSGSGNNLRVFTKCTKCGKEIH